MSSIARNDPCPCGSGKKYKKCCLGKDSAHVKTRNRRALLLGAVLLAVAGLLWFLVSPEIGKVAAGIAVAAVVAYLIFADPPSSHGHGDPGAIRFGR